MPIEDKWTQCDQHYDVNDVFYCSLKPKCSYFDGMLYTDCTGSSHFDKLSSKWRYFYLGTGYIIWVYRSPLTSYFGRCLWCRSGMLSSNGSYLSLHRCGHAGTGTWYVLVTLSQHPWHANSHEDVSYALWHTLKYNWIISYNYVWYNVYVSNTQPLICDNEIIITST